MSRIILIEFNELCPPLLDRWMAEGQLPNFKRLHDQAQVFVTEADERQAPNLEPWIQWYSLHTGIPYQTHRVFHLTDGPKAPFKDIWQHLLDAGKTVWNCSSMNAKGLSGDRALFLPDPWCASEKAHPAELGIFHRFVANRVQEYSNSDRPAGLGEAAGFVAFLATHGLRLGTIAAIAGQLAAERVKNRALAWKRAPLLDRLQFDVFRHYYRRRRPDFATFFVNSTAHLQHTYWRCMEPEVFTVKPSAEELERYRGAVLFGYRQMDRLVGDFLALAASNGATLMFATALSQQPYLKYEASGGHNFYRPRKVEALLDEIGVHPASIFPVMTHQYLVNFRSEQERDAAESRLAEVEVEGQPVFNFDPTNEPTSLYFGCGVNRRLSDDAVMRMSPRANAGRPFFEQFYRIDALKSGRHHPDGCFWVAAGAHRRHAGKASILDVAPTILARFGVSVPALVGRDLLAPPAGKDQAA